VRLGNELHVVWTQLRRGEIWYMRGILPGVAPRLPASVTGTTALAPSAALTVTEASPGPVLTAHPTAPFADLATPVSPETADNPLLYSIGAPAVVVLIAAGGALLVLRRRRQ